MSHLALCGQHFRIPSIDRRSYMQSDVRISDFRALFLEKGMIGDDKGFFREGLREVEGH